MLIRLLRRLRQPSPRLQPNPLLTTDFRQSVREYFCAMDGAGIARALSEYLPTGASVTVAFETAAVHHSMSCVWSLTKKCGSHFIFPILRRGQLLEVVVERWLSLLELFLSEARQGGDEGATVISFNDLAAEPGVAFCGNAPEHIYCLILPSRNRGAIAKRDDILPAIRQNGRSDRRGSSGGAVLSGRSTIRSWKCRARAFAC